MVGFNFEPKKVPLKTLQLEMEYDDSVPLPLRYDPRSYSLNRSNVLTPAAASLLLSLHSVYVIKKDHDLLVVAGKRVFQIASFCLEPSHEITVCILSRKTTPEQLLLLRYLDIVVSPLIQRTESSAADIFRSVNIPDLRLQAWSQRYSTTLSSFAAAMRMSPAALVTSPERKSKKALKRLTADAAGDVS